MSSRVTIFALGTRGDVQPAVALGKGLQAAGYDVRMAVSSVFADTVTKHGLSCAPIDVDVREMMESEAGKDWVESGSNPWRELFVLRDMMDSRAWQAAPGALRIAEESDVLISGFVTLAAVQAMAEKLGKPFINASLQPSLRSANGASLLYPTLPNRVSRFNLWGSRVSEALVWFIYRNSANRLRQDVLGLPPHSFRSFNAAIRATPTVLGYSRHVVPHPADWPPNVHTTGYWFLDGAGKTGSDDGHRSSSGGNHRDEWQPPAELRSFLDVGPPPVYVGFGSMTRRDPEGITRLIFDALESAGVRGLVGGGWAGLRAADVPDRVMVVESAPHEWLFPRTAGVVHHGGAGTTASGLRAGVPTTVVPHFSDQPFWARRVHALGVGPKPIPRQDLTAERLATAIRAMVADRAMQRRAAELGRKIEAEDGVDEAVRVIRSVVDPT